MNINRSRKLTAFSIPLVLLGVLRFQAAMRTEGVSPLLLRYGGVSAVRDEITRINNDYAKSRYFDELVKSGKLDTALLAQVERQLAREVKNSYYKARVFVTIAGLYLETDANLPLSSRPSVQ